MKIYNDTYNRTDKEIEVELLSVIVEINIEIDTIDIINKIKNGIIYNIKLLKLINIILGLEVELKKGDNVPV